MMHHTKDKGDLGVLKAQVDLFEQGFIVAFPVTEHDSEMNTTILIRNTLINLYL